MVASARVSSQKKLATYLLINVHEHCGEMKLYFYYSIIYSAIFDKFYDPLLSRRKFCKPSL